jgi:hypothetical protein
MKTIFPHIIKEGNLAGDSTNESGFWRGCQQLGIVTAEMD